MTYGQQRRPGEEIDEYNRIGLQEKGWVWDFMAQRREWAILVVFWRAMLGQHSRDIPTINMRYMSLCFSCSPQLRLPIGLD